MPPCLLPPSATLKGGTIGLVGGLVVSSLGTIAANRRFHFFRELTPQLKAFLITSGGTFSGIIAADHYSRAYEAERNPLDRQYAERERTRTQAERAGLTWTERAMAWGKKERYKIVAASWVASMFAAFSIVSRNKYLTGAQKLVQARVYAQFLTVGVLIASAAFEISDSKNEEGKLWETIKVVDPNDPEHKRLIEQRKHKEEWRGEDLWKEMVEGEEERLKAQGKTVDPSKERHAKKATEGGKKDGKKDGKEHKDDATDASKGKGK
jgi:hypothetical protein